MPLTLLRHATQKPPIGPQKLNIGNPLSKKLAAYWVLNEQGSATIYDAVRGLTGSLGTGVSWTSSVAGPALAFTGVSTQIISGSGGLEDIASNPYTVIARYLVTADIDNNFYFQIGSAFSTDKLLHLGDSFSQATRFNLFSDDSVINWSSKQLGNVHEVVTTQANDASNTKTVYLDGVQQATATATGLFSGDGSWKIGGVPAGSWYFNGTLMHVAVYGRALTAAEVRTFYAEPYAMFQTRPVQRWFTVVGAPTFDPGTMPWPAQAVPDVTLAVVGF